MAWQESRGRFFSALLLLSSVVIYAVVASLDRAGKPELYSVYIWSGLFHYALQGLWVPAAFILTLGGLRREKATGVAFFIPKLPVTRLRLFLMRAAVASAESIAFGLVPALLSTCDL